jgi:hypothetical protein
LQDALRKRREEEDRVAQQNEFLNRSVRGSKKLRELEHEPLETGIVNDGFSSEHDEDNTITVEEPQDPYEPIYRVVGECSVKFLHYPSLLFDSCEPRQTEERK